MKRILALAIMTAAIASCNLDGYTTSNGSVVCNFEYSSEAAFYTDSLFLTSPFYNGASYTSGNNIYYIAFNSNRKVANTEMTGGFGLTVKRDSSLVLKADNPYPQYTMYATSAALGSNGCAVFYQNPDESAMPEHDLLFQYAGMENCSCTPTECAINNTQLTVYSVLSDESDYKFGPGDWLKLHIVGYKNDLETGSVDYYLADYRGEGEKIDSVLTSWKTISLTKLGDIDYVDFNMECSKENFPTYFCLDNLRAGYVVSY